MSGFSRLKQGDALLIIDVQADFLAGGSLAVPNGDAVVAPLNEWIARFKAAGLPIFATLDWHPADHCSFREQQGAWPAHCVADTPGARLAGGLALPPDTLRVAKGTERDTDAYSGFSGTDLDLQLRRAAVGRLFVGGLATDYCVLQSVLDALRLGYRVVLLRAAIRAVDVQPGDGERAVAAMVTAGATVVED
ncbi:MAG: isochorismatase family protein [Sulfuritalea sp.]|nr:isochorismatase family protein [Sulfuritalea sp.]